MVDTMTFLSKRNLNALINAANLLLKAKLIILSMRKLILQQKIIVRVSKN